MCVCAVFVFIVDFLFCLDRQRQQQQQWQRKGLNEVARYATIWRSICLPVSPCRTARKGPTVHQTGCASATTNRFLHSFIILCSTSNCFFYYYYHFYCNRRVKYTASASDPHPTGPFRSSSLMTVHLIYHSAAIRKESWWATVVVVQRHHGQRHPKA